MSNKAFFYIIATNLLLMSLLALLCGLALPETWMIVESIPGIPCSIWLFRVAKCCFANKLRKIFTQSAKKKWRLKGF